jgi:hypothetical protein
VSSTYLLEHLHRRLKVVAADIELDVPSLLLCFLFEWPPQLCNAARSALHRPLQARLLPASSSTQRTLFSKANFDVSTSCHLEAIIFLIVVNATW